MSEGNQRSIKSFFGVPKRSGDENSIQEHSESRPFKSARISSLTLSDSESHHSLDLNWDKPDTNEEPEVEFISISKVSTLQLASSRADSRVWKWKEEYKELFK